MTTKDKSEVELLIEAMADIFNIATDGFSEFSKDARETASGKFSKAASSGDYSAAASSGDYSAAAVSGYSSTAASSGYSSKAAVSGDYSTAAGAGDSSKAAAAGYSSTAASSGSSSKAASAGSSSAAASSGYSSAAASSGDYSAAASSGNYSKAAATGDSSKAASSGYSSKAAVSGDSSTAAVSGNYSTAAAAGDSSKAAAVGYSSKAAAAGDYSTAAVSGNYSTAASSGNYSACAAVGYRAAVKGDMGNLLMASEYVRKDGEFVPVGGKADLVDGKKLKPDRWYIVEQGEWVEVDFSDGIFSRVISHKAGVKKVRTDDGQVLFVVQDDKGNTAHGETIAKARKDLVYKAVAKFDDPIPKKATGKEWVAIYRAVTGACAAGVKLFVEQTGTDLEQVYTAKAVAELARGQYGAEQFGKKVGA
jgi:hypothetical protein